MQAWRGEGSVVDRYGWVFCHKLNCHITLTLLFVSTPFVLFLLVSDDGKPSFLTPAPPAAPARPSKHYGRLEFTLCRLLLLCIPVYPLQCTPPFPTSTSSVPQSPSPSSQVYLGRFLRHVALFLILTSAERYSTAGFAGFRRRIDICVPSGVCS